jgi:hypothetical protein
MRSSLRIRAALMLSFLVTLLFASAQAIAQGGEPSAADRARARRLFEEATELEAKHEWSLAATKLQEALGVVETPGLRYHLAYCQEGQGLMVEALANYERAQQMIAGGSKAPDVAELLAPKRDALLARIPKLRVRARAPAVLERVTVDGAALTAAQASEPIPLNPGRRKVTAWAQGQPGPLEREVVLAEGRETTEEFAWPGLALAAAANPAASGPPPPQLDRAEPSEPAPSSGLSARTVVLIAEAAVAVVGIGVGIGFIESSRDAAQEAEFLRGTLTGNPCGTPTPDVAARCAALADANDRERDHERIATGAFITAGVSAAAMVTTFFLWKPAPDGAAIGVSVTPTAQGGALGLRGRF